MKKKHALIVGIALCAAALIVFFVVFRSGVHLLEDAAAAELVSPDYADTGTPCYIATPECPEEYIRFVRTQYAQFLPAASDLTGADEADVIGTPFAFADEGPTVWYFPVISNGEIRMLVHVWRGERDFAFACSTEISDGLNGLTGQTSAENPLRLTNRNGDVVALLGDAEHVLIDYPEETDTADLLPIEELTVQNVKAAFLAIPEA